MAAPFFGARPQDGPTAVDQQRALLEDARRELRRAAIAAADAAAKLDGIRRNRDDNSDAAVRAAEAGVERAQGALAGLRGRAREELAGLAVDLGNFITTPEQEVARLSARYPIALFPVRIETRFTADQLLLRVYPDEILSDSFEPELTDEEVADGQAYWDAAWPGEAEEKLAWRAIVKKIGVPRASWVVETMTPTNLATRPAGTPTIKAPARRTASWTRPAEAQLLPDRWHVLLDTGDGERIVSGSAIHEPLSLTFSPDPADPTDPLGPDGLRLSSDVLWTVDFAQAEKVGMGVRIPLTQGERALGFRRVIVFGVKSSLAPDVSAGGLKELLSHHRHGRGFTLLPQGTPTNNTSAATTPFPPNDGDGTRSFAVERTGLPVVAGRDGPRLTTALGLSNDTAIHLDGADGREAERGSAMSRALWPVTWGYFLEELMKPVFEAADISTARSFFVNHVRGRGPYSAFRIGGTPYGVLPVSSLQSWQPARQSDAADRALPANLRTLRAIWLGQSGQVPRVGRSGDPDQDLMEILGLDASTREVRVRPVLGEDATWNLFGFWGWNDAWTAWLDAGQALANQVFTLIGHPEWRPRIAKLNYDPNAWPFKFHLVTEDPVSETLGLTPNYIEWIRTASVPDLIAQSIPAEWDKPVSLLYRLLRHGGLLEYQTASYLLGVRFQTVEVGAAVEREIVGIPGAVQGPTRVQQMMQPIGQLSGTAPVHSWLSDPANAAIISSLLPDEPVVGFRDALAALSGASTAELERLLGETLDVVSHRIDAWITALPSKRLEQMRSSQPLGCHLAAYGWVEDLRPRPASSAHPVELRDGTIATRQDGNGGYVHAPSMTHAAAAAILRNGYLSRTGDDRKKYAVDLSSARVRAGRFVLDAVREGQPIGAVFGYQMERGLHDRNLDKWIAPLRARYPLVAGKSGDPDDYDPNDPDQPKEHIAAQNVVDGLALRRAYQAGGIPWGQFGLPNGGADQAGVEAELGRLDQTVDATSDLLLGEAVYQLVKGSPNVAAATLDAMAQGAVRPPDPEIATQPRRGTPLTHKVALLLGGNGKPLPAGYPAPTPRSQIEPLIDAWLGQLFGKAADYECGVEFGPEDAPTGITTVSLQKLKLRPIDVLVLAKARGEPQPDATRAEASELDRRILEGAHANLGLTEETPGRITYGRPDAGFDPATDRSFTDLLELARTAADIIAKSRPLTPEDLVAEDRPDDAKTADHRTGDAIARATAARQALDAAALPLSQELAFAQAALEGAPFNLSNLRKALRDVAAIGVTGAYPISSFGHDLTTRQQLIAQAVRVLAEATRRVTRSGAVLTEAAKPEHASDTRFLFGAAREVLDIVCGAELPFAPLFEVPAQAELANAIAHSGTAAFIDADPVVRKTALQDFERTALRVRPPLDAWRRLEIVASSLGRDRAQRALAQLPYYAGARWVALPFASEADRPGPGRISILFYQADTPAVGQPWAGLLLDHWSEIIPFPDEQTGVAFHYDDPGAEAPQTVLLAVPPVAEAESWSLSWLTETLKETLEMARIRAVDGELLGLLSQLLPAICLADSTDEVTVRSNFLDAVALEANLVQLIRRTG
jgi:hypothetical protein